MCVADFNVMVVSGGLINSLIDKAIKRVSSYERQSINQRVGNVFSKCFHFNENG